MEGRHRLTWNVGHVDCLIDLPISWKQPSGLQLAFTTIYCLPIGRCVLSGMRVEYFLCLSIVELTGVLVIASGGDD